MRFPVLHLFWLCRRNMCEHFLSDEVSVTEAASHTFSFVPRLHTGSFKHDLDINWKSQWLLTYFSTRILLVKKSGKMIRMKHYENKNPPDLLNGLKGWSNKSITSLITCLNNFWAYKLKYKILNYIKHTNKYKYKLITVFLYMWTFLSL